MTSTFFANTNSKIRKLKEDKSYPVIPKSGLNVVKRGTVSYTHLTLPTTPYV